MISRAIFCFVSLLLLVSCSNDQPDTGTSPSSQANTATPSAGATPAPAPAAPATTNPNPSQVAAAQAAPTTKPAATSKMAPTPAITTRETELKEKPFVDAKTLKRLPANTSIAIADRNGGWLRVTSGGQDGWVRLLHVSSQPTARGTSTQELESAAKIATGRAGTGNIVTTTGIRGLSEGELRQAKPNPEEFQRLEGYAVSKEQAAAYASKHQLERRQLAHFPESR